MSDGRPSPKWNQLDQLPFLNAVINEALRVGHGISHRLQRISPDIALQYKEWTIPANTPVSMSSILMHNNPTIFPDPKTFLPDRWLQPSEVRLQKYLIPFSKGTRQCLGMNLAYCELYLTVAAIFAPGRFHFKLYETDDTDVEIAHDYFTANFPDDSKGIQILVE
ncbi:hypothetical protein MMC07_004441 [Pseudocyphellaria aurata]|nr:hypothetical protein [Pseudocyphellaria aurata]